MVLDINDNGTMLLGDSHQSERYLSYNGELTPIVYNGVEDVNPIAEAINNKGDLAGNIYYGEPKGFYYDGETFTVIEYPGAKGTTVWGMNDKGQLVGSYTNSYQDFPFVYDNGIYQTVRYDYNGSNTLRLNDINNEGNILGSYRGWSISGDKDFCVVGESAL